MNKLKLPFTNLNNNETRFFNITIGNPSTDNKDAQPLSWQLKLIEQEGFVLPKEISGKLEAVNKICRNNNIPLKILMDKICDIANKMKVE